MNRLEAALRRVVADLEDLGVRWALVGGLAVSVRAEPRTTRDVDIAVAVSDDAEAELVISGLVGRGFRVVATVEQTATDRLATVRLASGRGRSVVVDVLFASSGIEPEVVDGAETLTILPGLDAHVASIGHLVALKILARDDRHRPQDWDDIRALLREASERDIEVARSSVARIASRGFARRRDIAALLEEAISELGERP